MKISTRLISGFGLIILLSIICTGTALQALYKARESMNEIVNIKMKKSNLAQDMLGEIKDMGNTIRTIGLLSEPAEMQSVDKRMLQSKADFIANYQLLSGIMKTDSIPAGREAMQKLNDTKEAFLRFLSMPVSSGSPTRTRPSLSTYEKNSVRFSSGCSQP